MSAVKPKFSRAGQTGNWQVEQKPSEPQAQAAGAGTCSNLDHVAALTVLHSSMPYLKLE